MKGTLSNTKGTLIEMFIEFDNGQGLTIQPLFNDAAIIAFGNSANEHLKTDKKVDEGHIVVFDHAGNVVGDYAMSANIKAIENTVLYTNGTVWSGSVFDELEQKNISYVVLTEAALAQLANPNGLSFTADKTENKPTILVGYKGGVQPMCGWHHCNKCRFADKLILNGLSGSHV